MEFNEETSQKLIEYLKQEDIRNVCIKLEMFSESDSLEERFKKTKKYIVETMRGIFIGNEATKKFLEVMPYYLKNNDFERFNENQYIPDGFINYNILLPMVADKKRDGFRVLNDILGFDGKKYIVKQAEGLKMGASGKIYAKDARYNPTVAYAFFKYLEQPCAKNLPACEKPPYYYILSENFLKENQKAYGVDDRKFIDAEFVIDEDNNITHNQIIDGIEEAINKKDLSLDKKTALIKKVKLQYAIQETLKCLICSMDQNLGNTSLIVTEGENGEIKDINISPAYDIDLSFNLGEEMLNSLDKRSVLYRTTQDGKIDLISIINEFKSIDGYQEQIQEIANKFRENYIEKIFDIAYNETKVEQFRSNETRCKYGNFLARRVAMFKEACKTMGSRNEKMKSE